MPAQTTSEASPPNSRSTVEFLNAILPATGKRCVTTIVDKRARNFFFATNEQAAEFIVTVDRKLEGTNGAVYHACATYDESGRRTQAAVVAVRSLWADVDVGVGKPYGSLVEATAAVKRFIGASGYGNPLVCRSGRGLHLYWLLDREVGPAEWRDLAAKFRSRCDELGLAVDPSRSLDSASILRPVGSTWRKEGSIRVCCGPRPLPLAVGRVSEGSLPEPGHPVGGGLHLGPRHANPLPRLNHGDLKTYDRVDFESLVAGCAQLSYFKESRGNIPEPLWYAGLGVLGHCDGGDAVGQEWSKGHPTYDERETAGRLVRARQLTGPTTCERFHELNPSVCEACPFWKKAKTPLDAVKYEAPLKFEQPDEKPYSDFGAYRYLKDGSLVLRSEGNDGAAIDHKICSFPIYLAGVQTSEGRKDKRFYRFESWSPVQKSWVRIEIPVGDFHGSGGIGSLANRGVEIHNWNFFRQFVRDSVDRLRASMKETVLYEQMGWKEGDTAFLLGDAMIRGNAVERVPVGKDVEHRAKYMTIRPEASLLEWKAAGNKLFQGGSESISFSILASFAAPLIKFLEDEEGGTIVSLVTRASGAGKTTVLSGARTVWSWHERALSHASHDTKNSADRSMGILGNLPMFNDEFNERDPDIVRQDIMRFTSGRARDRLNADGTMNQSDLNWNTTLFIASNRSTSALLNDSRSDAAAMRVLEMPVESGDGGFDFIKAGQLKATLERNGGVAGLEFMKYVTQPEVLALIRRQLPERGSQIVDQYKAFQKKHRFWVRELAAVSIASVIVENRGLLDFSAKRVMDWAYKFFSLAADESTGNDISPLSATEMLGRYLAENIDATLIADRAWAPNKPRMVVQKQTLRKLLIRKDNDTNFYFLAQYPFRKWLQDRDVDWLHFKDQFKVKGAHQPMRFHSRFMSLGAGTDYPSAQVPCISFDGNHPLLSGVEIERGAEAKVVKLRP